MSDPRNASAIDKFHWHTELLQNLDVGLVVLDRDYRVQLWNRFMVNHSGMDESGVLTQSIFSLFAELPEKWLKGKMQSVFMLRNRSFITWQERTCLFNFKPDRPFTGKTKQMYQNVTLIPLTNPEGTVTHIGIIIYDMTDAAISHQRLAKANEELQSLSRTDRLTGLNNRGYWEECLEREYNRFLRSGQPSCLIMLDIDHFKKINDTYGHPAGDKAIRALSSLIQNHIRSTDIAGRYGGEEFAILLPDTADYQAEVLAERLRLAVQALEIVYREQSFVFTISLGIAQASADDSDHDHWLRRADQALYQSKLQGRDQTTLL
ncbi:sensor domain-containing diguanylate cyclase [Marinobacterium mangrovicola]|uniref:diguanylate cyclase n=1 Tax=Marinobacterium mangrovicola TaxID=1476959 RepID=A0A4R1GVN5_9GAMM|nr:diguanylate cyclase [Marinobacterium mangrovicola]TCK08432.1 diguanylate cyclase (GGDEF)-like protein [Marinobacterium mangrovicola]